ncbi:putative leptin receptor [Vairimorpha necatrix]|uniref:Leptin receptor n=1 Tax=Vairimorpha necatrix TaxID=6039 RepID=A0AAX4JD14_9MICR
MSEGSRVNITFRKKKWTTTSVIITVLMFISGILCILLGLNPLLDLEFDLKSFSNLIFVVFHLYYLCSFMGVNTNSDFIFWGSSYILLIVSSIMFYYYDDIFV